MKFKLLLVLYGCFLWGQAPAKVPCFTTGVEQVTVKEGEHTKWDVLLKKHVDASGLVDYKGFLKDVAALNSYLNDLSGMPPAESASREEKLAYYINLYNAATVKLILDHYPIESIKDIKSPWDTKWIPLDGKLLSLGEIEHDILRKMDEPRIHFAINCASYSCPALLNFAFEPATLNTQLEQATIGFIRDTTRNKIAKGSLELSQIFQWYKRDFTGHGSLREYIDGYSDIDIDSNARISYLKYDWSLNEAD